MAEPIKSKMRDVQEAFIAFAGSNKERSGIGNAALPAKAAYRVAKLIKKLNSEVDDFSEARRKVMLTNGGVARHNLIAINAPEQKPDETDEQFAARLREHEERVAKVDEEIEGLLDMEVDIDYEPIPLSLFEKCELRPNDLAAAGDFIKED